jgi:hypothetical protein
VRLTVDRAVYVYAGPQAWNWEKAAGSCEVDVTCHPEWADLAKGVGGIGTVGRLGYLWCTGTLVTDRDPQTAIPYFLTANHCVGNASEADSLEVYWLYQTPTCNGTPPAPRTVPRTTGGADFLAGVNYSTGNDFTLLRLRGNLPSGLTFVGWETNATANGTNVVGIHHPDGDYKRISFGTVDQTVPPRFGYPATRFYGVHWSLGVTEPGSSGSPLFDATSQRIIGQLWGGTSSCSLPDDPDIYGRFDQTYPVVKSYLGQSLNVTAPNGGELWARGSTHSIQWTSSSSGSGTVLIELLNGGTVQSTLAASAPDNGSFSWTVPSSLPLGSTYRIRITLNADAGVTDTSDTDFSIGEAPSLTVMSPNGGESWGVGSRQNITWSSTGLTGTVRIELRQNGTTVATVADSTENDGTFSWLLPTSLAAGTSYSIRVVSNNTPSIADESNGTLSIVVQPAVTVLTPDGGENWALGSTHSLTWSSVGLDTASVKIELLRGSLPGQVALTIAASAEDNGTYTWTIPTDLATASDYRVRITSLGAGGESDTSDGTFFVGNCTPTAPGSVNATDGTYTDQVQVTWSAVNGANSYRVLRGTTNQASAATPLSSWVAATAYIDTTAALMTASTGGCAGGTAAKGEVYYYWVQARNDCGVSGLSTSDQGYRGTGARSLNTAQTAGLGDTLVSVLTLGGLATAGRLRLRRRGRGPGNPAAD